MHNSDLCVMRRPGRHADARLAMQEGCTALPHELCSTSPPPSFWDSQIGHPASGFPPKQSQFLNISGAGHRDRHIVSRPFSSPICAAS